MVIKEETVATKRAYAAGRLGRTTRAEPRTGSSVTVTFGRHDAVGTVVGKTITGRYTVKVQVEGAGEPVVTSYTRDELHLA
ncbi:hypothetical protein ACVWW9_000889 [Agrococcus sp. UYP33]